MREIILFAEFILLIGELQAQQPRQLFIPSFENTQETVYLCDGVRQNEVQLNYALANLFHQDGAGLDFTIDSLLYIFDSTKFSGVRKTGKFELAQYAFLPGPTYRPTSAGTDTVTIIGYYGSYFSIGKIICHAYNSTGLGLYGIGYSTLNFGANSVSIPNELVKEDTLHDHINNGLPYNVSSTPQPHLPNDVVELRACTNTVIDSIYTVGDFSEFEFVNLPQAAVSLVAGQKLQISYNFTPKVPGKRDHFLVFHTTDGRYLVWSFEYRVLGSQSVSIDNENETFTIFPSPASKYINLEPKSGKLPTRIKILTIHGVVVADMAVHADENQARIVLPHLPNGAYTVLAYSEAGTYWTEKLIIAH